MNTDKHGFSDLSLTPPFNQVFDVVIVGSGLAGYAAAMTLRDRNKSVLLIGPRGDLLWEAGRCFHPHAGRCDDPHWRGLVEAAAQRGGWNGQWLDGAIAEIVATDLLAAGGIAALYYAQPIALERESDGRPITSAIVATKSGLRRVAGRQWIDATEQGQLHRLADPSWAGRPPASTWIHLNLQHADWSAVPGAEGLQKTAWRMQRVLSIAIDPTPRLWRHEVLAALDRLREQLGEAIGAVSMTHPSIEPIAVYDAAPVQPAPAGADNLVSASPAAVSDTIHTLADRFHLGLRAAGALADHPVHRVDDDVFAQPLPDIAPAATLAADVCVAGTGTGGVMAALAARQSGASVRCIEPLAFAGGIGVGGGIHAYYWGVAGGLQQTLDERTRDLMKRYQSEAGSGPLGDGPFNPWAKMIAIEQLFADAGVDLHLGATLFDVERQGERVTAAHIATDRGVLRIEARAYVDGTGDGDLCAMAGADFTLGREHDGLLHAYSQSAGLLRDLHGRPRMSMINFDAGFCDPTDPADLTRARLAGVRQYMQEHYDDFIRPTYIAPAIGLRQGRQVVTRYILSLDDQISRRRFDDVIGYTGCHYENHAVDYEFESDESIFWVWVNRQWLNPFACEMSYRMIVPRGLANVWIGSRCLGVSQDAHYTCRMQRDIQRIGEAAGFAAALATTLDVRAAELPYAPLRRRLDATGALEKPVRGGVAPLFAEEISADALDMPDGQRSLDRALAALDGGVPGPGIWWLYQHCDAASEAVRQRLDRERPMVSWLAACVLAMWGDAAAQPRFLRAIIAREYGYGEAYAPQAGETPDPLKDKEPLNWKRVVPNWLCAAALLRRCGDEACLPALMNLARTRPLALSTATTVALTLEHLVQRGMVEQHHNAITELLDEMIDAPLVGVIVTPQRNVGQTAELAMRGELAHDHDTHPPAMGKDVYINPTDDFTWQLHVAIARARAALGLAPHEQAVALLDDPRGPVRRAIRNLMEPLCVI